MIAIGQKDSRGNLLVLGGWNADLYRTSVGTYMLQGRPADPILIKASEDAIKFYNALNKTKLGEDYVDKWFEPWYKKNKPSPVVFEMPSSSSPDKKHKITLDGGYLTCDCEGFKFRRTCSHVEVVRDFLRGLEREEKRATSDAIKRAITRPI